jgi:hypothetical protein
MVSPGVICVKISVAVCNYVAACCLLRGLCNTLNRSDARGAYIPKSQAVCHVQLLIFGVLPPWCVDWCRDTVNSPQTDAACALSSRGLSTSR